MKRKNEIFKLRRRELKQNFGKFKNCICSAEQFKPVDQMAPTSESFMAKDYSASDYSSKGGESEKQLDNGNIEEAEWSLRETSSLNYEEARALLGRIEYQKGNIEAALHVFEGIDIAAATSKMKVALASRRVERRKRRSQNYASPAMSVHAVSLLLEAIFLKAKSLQGLGRFKEAAQSCKVILDIVESSLPEGLPENLGADCKLQETLNKAVELLPELWKLADSPGDAILSYRRALLHHWNLDAETTAKIQKELAVFLLYSGGGDASPPNLRSQMDSSFVPRNNMEEAILLLMILLRKITLKRIEWDPSILDHLSFALSISGDLLSLANRVEELLPGIISRKERYHILALCYYGASEDLAALNLLRKLLNHREDPNCIPALLLASKICGENLDLAGEGVSFARRALECFEESKCNRLESTANYLLGKSLSAKSKLAVSDSDRAPSQLEALQALESAGRSMGMRDPNILYHLSLENAEQRKLDAALYYAKSLLKLEGGSNVKGWLLMARILSAQKRFVDAETIIDAALEQTGKWDQVELLRTKAKLQIAQGHLKSAIGTYTELLAVLQIQNKTFGSGKKLHKGVNPTRSLELEVWHDLALVYISLSQWGDAEVCLSKSRAISSYSATRCHMIGVLYEKKGLPKEALRAFRSALSIDPTHVPSLISIAVVLRHLDSQSNVVVRSFLMEALRLDRMNPSAWFNLGLVYKADSNISSQVEAAECFEAAAKLEDSAPVEPFR